MWCIFIGLGELVWGQVSSGRVTGGASQQEEGKSIREIREPQEWVPVLPGICWMAQDKALSVSGHLSSES